MNIIMTSEKGRIDFENKTYNGQITKETGSYKHINTENRQPSKDTVKKLKK